MHPLTRFQLFQDIINRLQALPRCANLNAMALQTYRVVFQYTDDPRPYSRTIAAANEADARAKAHTLADLEQKTIHIVQVVEVPK